MTEKPPLDDRLMAALLLGSVVLTILGLLAVQLFVAHPK